MNGNPIKPEVCRLPDGRIGVFLGADYKFMPPEDAQRLRDALNDALANSHEPKRHPAPSFPHLA